MLWSNPDHPLTARFWDMLAMLTCYSYARLKLPASGKEQLHKYHANGAPVTRSAAALAPRLEGFVESRDGQALRIASGGRSICFTKPSACGKVQLVNTTDLAGRVKTITPGARAN